MTVAAFNVIYNPVIYEKLAKELESCFPDKTSQLPFVELERLPLLVSNISYISMDKTKLTTTSFPLALSSECPRG
jgi:hypothetical protein